MTCVWILSLPLISPQTSAVPGEPWWRRLEDGGWGEGPSGWHVVEGEEKEAEEEAEDGERTNVSSGEEKWYSILGREWHKGEWPEGEWFEGDREWVRCG